ncbi:MAG: 50S ribosome-binding GTPase [bacterium]|nr:50S ribosome-binding GTPase [bacterium]
MSEKCCLGCGVKLQDANIAQAGYTTSLENDYCRRCFRMKNYGEYQTVAKSNEEYIEILKAINETNDLVVHVVDILNLDSDLAFIRKYIGNEMILVINKIDVLPCSTKEEKLLAYIDELQLNYRTVILISANKNYHIDELYKLICKHKTSRDVYFVGRTNTGKSSLINQLIKNYSNSNKELTISPLPSTTLNKISIDLSHELTVIDTPGLVDGGSLVHYVDSIMLKKISPRKEIKPRTYQLKKNQCLIIGDLVRVDYVEGEKNSFTLYLSNDVKVKRMNALKHDCLKDLCKVSYELKYCEDIVIHGLGWIKVVEKGSVDLYLDKNIETFVRKNLI